VQQSELKDEIDFRDLIRKPEKLFGYSPFYFLGALLLLGMLYLSNINAVGRNAISPAALADSAAFVADIPFQSPAVLPPVDVLKAGFPSDSLVYRGRDIFRANCTPCHGETGLGDGPTSATLNPKPRNFHSLAGWTNGSKVSQIYKTLQEGIVRNGMASYNYMPPADRFALAHYIRTLSPGQPADTKDDLLALEALYQLSKGSNIAGQIPIKKAAQAIVAEQESAIARVQRVVAMAESDLNPGAVALRSVTADLRRVVTGIHARKEGMPPFGEFVQAVTADPAAAGFKPVVSRLGNAEWSLIYSYLGKLSEQVHFQG
jgi:mono/diheme cytochrome c family protein